MTKNSLQTSHFNRVKDAVKDVFSLNSLSKWIEKFVILDGKRLSFAESHYFQREILDDSARIVNIVKPAQIGITTATMCYILAVLATQRQMNVIYVLPSSTDAEALTATKLNPLMQGSPEVKRIINSDVDNLKLKQIGSNFLYIRGTKSETAAFSVSADLLVVDEFDKCDADTAMQFRSRLQGSPLKMIRQFSTPTTDGVGITREAETSRRYRHFATCKHCAHQWLPSYHSDIVIPDFTGELSEINKYNLKDIRWQEARWDCPQCHNDPNLHKSRMTWICENPNDNYEANTYFLTPATAYAILTPSYMVSASTTFNSRAEFLNQVLGETSLEERQQMSMADISRAMTHLPLASNEMHCFGADMGQTCTVAIGRITESGKLLVVHRELVPLGKFEIRRRELCAQYRCLVSVMDTQPETYLVTRITEYDHNAHGSIFTTGKSAELYTLQQKDENPKEGRLNLRQVKISRNLAFDTLMALFKDGDILIQASEQDDYYAKQYLDMRRAQVFNKDNEMVFQWQKSSEGEDHGFFSLMYLMIACKLKKTATGGRFLSTPKFVHKFQILETEAKRGVGWT